MLLIFFFKVDIKHTFVFPETMLHTGKIDSKDYVAFSKGTLKSFLKTSFTKMLFNTSQFSLREKIDILFGFSVCLLTF